MYLPSSKIEVRSLRRNSKGFYGVPIYVSRLLFLRGKSGNLLAARQLLASQKIVNCEWIRSTETFWIQRYRNLSVPRPTAEV
jgi:predicted HAD superfamily hydrolase